MLRYAGAAILVWMGVSLVRKAGALAAAAGGPARERGWSGFAAGLTVIAGNPKAILFYAGVLPGFFDFRADRARRGGDLPRLGGGAVPLQPRLGGAVRAGAAVARRPGGDAAGACRGAGLALVAVGVAIAVG